VSGVLIHAITTMPAWTDGHADRGRGRTQGDFSQGGTLLPVLL